MPSKKIKTPLTFDRYYHIYNRGNNRENIFYKDEHYQFFIKKYTEMIHPYVNTYAYCLLPNHFHFLLKIDPFASNIAFKQPSHLFRKFFQCYAIWFNKRQNRRGSLFTKYYRRIEITNEDYLRRLILYIHMNPVKHGISQEFKTYPYSSFGSYLSFQPGIVSQTETLSWFNDNMLEFLDFHDLSEEKPDLRDLIIEK
ncbi:MAG: transposase [Bacteroidales bacterium]|nr:transposase [Bacteroidales bacterium]